MIHFDNVSFSYEESVIKNCSFHIARGEKVSLMGPSGLGKTTLLELISKKLKPQSGTISISTENVSMVFQRPSLIPWLTAAENVRIVHPEKSHSEAVRWLCLAGLEGYENALPHELSGGMQQRAAIARALAHDGELFLLDEPFSSLDEKACEDMAKLILENTAGKTLVLVTHRPEQASMMTTRSLTLKNGAVFDKNSD